MFVKCLRVLGHSVVSDSLQPNRLQAARLICPLNFPNKNTEVGCHFLLQRVFDLRIKPESLAPPALVGGFFTTEPPGNPFVNVHIHNYARYCCRCRRIIGFCSQGASDWVRRGETDSCDSMRNYGWIARLVYSLIWTFFDNYALKVA